MTIDTDIVDSDVPLLLSRASMKRAAMQIDFKNDTIEVFGQKTDLVVTKSGHYTIPISPYKQLLNNVNINPKTCVTLINSSNKSKEYIASK